jgi:hypothetical protein
MLNLIIDNPIVENFYYQECNEDIKIFIKKISYFIEINKAKQKINTAFTELELVKNGKLKTIPINNIFETLEDKRLYDMAKERFRDSSKKDFVSMENMAKVFDIDLDDENKSIKTITITV